MPARRITTTRTMIKLGGPLAASREAASGALRRFGTRFFRRFLLQLGFLRLSFHPRPPAVSPGLQGGSEPMSKTLNLVNRGIALATFWHRLRRATDARRLLDGLSRLELPADPAAADSQCRLAVLYLRQRHFRRARRPLIRALRIDKTNARAH